MITKTLTLILSRLLVVFMVAFLTQPVVGCSSSDGGGSTEGTETTADGTTGDESTTDTQTATGDAGPEGSTDSAEATKDGGTAPTDDVNSTDSEQGIEDVTETEMDVMEADGEQSVQDVDETTADVTDDEDDVTDDEDDVTDDEDDVTETEDDVTDDEDGAVAQTDDASTDDISETTTDDTSTGGPDEDTTTSDEDTTSSGLGVFGSPCESSDDCEGGVACVPGMETWVCSQPCADELCPDGWVCGTLYAGDSEVVCLYAALNLCRPCETNDDCLIGGGSPGDLCVASPDGVGSFCGNSCTTDDDCPGGYHCADIASGGAGSDGQCQADSGVCGCNWWAIEGTASTGCGEGTCVDHRQCTESGLSDCEVFLSGVEICDAVDNDCDGYTDEAFPAAMLEWSCDGADEDFCFGGVWVCDAGAAAGIACSENLDAQGLTSQGELCDDQDNDCDDLVDEDFPTLGELCDGNDADLCETSVWTCSEDQRFLVCEEDTPGIFEICDGEDNDCDGATDEDDVCGGSPFGVPGVVALDGLTLTVYRTMDEGQTWEEMGNVGLSYPTVPHMAAGVLDTLYVGTYVNISDAASLGTDKGLHISRSDDGGATWLNLGLWSDTANSPSGLCADAKTGEIYALDYPGNVYYSNDEGVTFEQVGVWEPMSGTFECVVTQEGHVVIVDAAYCGDPADSPCSAVWMSSDAGATFTHQGFVTLDGSGSMASLATGPDGNVYSLIGENRVFSANPSDLTNWVQVGVVPTGSKSAQVITIGPDGTLYAATATSACAGAICSSPGETSCCDPATAGGHFFVSKDGGATWEKAPVDWISGGSGSGWVELSLSKYPPQ